MSDPTAPVVVQTLPLTVTSENIYALEAPDRSLLVAGGAPSAAGQPIPAFVWDVRDCTNPVLLGTVGFPGLSPGNPAVQSQIHNIELTPDGKKIYGSLPLQVADISNLADPSTWTVQGFQCELAAQAEPGFSGFLFSQARFALDFPECANLLAHEFEFNKAGTRMYIGGQMSGTSATQLDPLHRPWHTEVVLRVVDITVWPPQVIGSVEPAPGHGVRRATIGGKPFLLNSNENVNPDFRTVNGCHEEPDLIRGAAQAFLTDISDETAPQTVSELELAINKETNCAAQLESRVRASIHYAELNDPDRTKFAMVSMGNAGLRVFDVRHPSTPREVAYWNPGMFLLPTGSAAFDATSWHSRYVSLKVPCSKSSKKKCDASYILVTSRLGFWVLELEPLIRLQLGLPLNLITTKYILAGRPGRPTSDGHGEPPLESGTEEARRAHRLSPAQVALRSDPVAARGARPRLRDGDLRPRAEHARAGRDEEDPPARQVAAHPRRRRRASRVGRDRRLHRDAPRWRPAGASPRRSGVAALRVLAPLRGRLADGRSGERRAGQLGNGARRRAGCARTMVKEEIARIVRWVDADMASARLRQATRSPPPT